MHECIRALQSLNQPLKHPLLGFERSFPQNIFCNPDMMVTSTQIQLSEINKILQSIWEIIYTRERILFFHRDLVDSPIIQTHSPCAILLRYQHN